MTWPVSNSFHNCCRYPLTKRPTNPGTLINFKPSALSFGQRHSSFDWEMTIRPSSCSANSNCSSAALQSSRLIARAFLGLHPAYLAQSCPFQLWLVAKNLSRDDICISSFRHLIAIALLCSYLPRTVTTLCQLPAQGCHLG